MDLTLPQTTAQSGSQPYTPPPGLRNLQIPDRVVDPGISQEACVAHLHLLEKFVYAEERVRNWALDNDVPPASAWRFYINSAVCRFVRWLEWFGVKRPEAVVPPIDVLLVWHAFLQYPLGWQRFVNMSGVPRQTWCWRSIMSIVEKSDEHDFVLSEASYDFAKGILGTVDIMETLQSTVDEMQGDGINSAQRSLLRLFLDEQEVVKMKAPAGTMLLTLRSHAVVELQLTFAKKMIRYSWHRMPSRVMRLGKRHGQHRPFIARAITRYSRFIAMVKAWHEVRKLEPVSVARKPSVLTPSLDVDLVWRTHLLSPVSYKELCEQKSELGLIPHLVTVQGPGDKKDDAVTAIVYGSIFQEKFHVCLSWRCAEGSLLRSLMYFASTRARQLQQSLGSESSRRSEIPADIEFKKCRKCGSDRDGEREEDHSVGPSGSEWSISTSKDQPSQAFPRANGKQNTSEADDTFRTARHERARMPGIELTPHKQDYGKAPVKPGATSSEAASTHSALSQGLRTVPNPGSSTNSESTAGPTSEAARASVARAPVVRDSKSGRHQGPPPCPSSARRRRAEAQSAGNEGYDIPLPPQRFQHIRPPSPMLPPPSSSFWQNLDGNQDPQTPYAYHGLMARWHTRVGTASHREPSSLTSSFTPSSRGAATQGEARSSYFPSSYSSATTHSTAWEAVDPDKDADGINSPDDHHSAGAPSHGLGASRTDAPRRQQDEDIPWTYVDDVWWK